MTKYDVVYEDVQGNEQTVPLWGQDKEDVKHHFKHLFPTRGKVKAISLSSLTPDEQLTMKSLWI